MQLIRYSLMLGLTGVLMTVAGCSSTPKSPDVSGSIKDSLKQAGFNDVSVSQDRTKGIVTLSGHVPSDADKNQADSIAKSGAAGEVVADEIAVLPNGGESNAKDVNSDLDKGIQKNLDAAYRESGIHQDLKDVKTSVKNGVVTLKGDVDSNRNRTTAQTIAAGVPNVQQVVNELEVKKQKATSAP